MSFNLLLRSAPPSLSLINPQRPLFTLASSVNNGHSIGHYFYCNTRRINPILGRISKSQPSSTAHPRSKSLFSSLSHPWCWCKVKVVQPSQEQSSIRTLNSYLHSPCFIILVRQCLSIGKSVYFRFNDLYQIQMHLRVLFFSSLDHVNYFLISSVLITTMSLYWLNIHSTFARRSQRSVNS